MSIKTNNKFRKLVCFSELTLKEQKEFDWLESPEEESFFRYDGWVYALSGAMILEHTPPWHGYYSMTAFSAVVIQLSRDGERVKVGTTCAKS